LVCRERIVAQLLIADLLGLMLDIAHNQGIALLHFQVRIPCTPHKGFPQTFIRENFILFSAVPIDKTNRFPDLLDKPGHICVSIFSSTVKILLAI
jgi:hypothetical protein